MLDALDGRTGPIPLAAVACWARASALFLEYCRVGAVGLLFVVFPRRPARRGGCHTLASLCLPRQMPLPLLRSWEAITAARAASGRGLAQLTASVGLWPGCAYMFYVGMSSFVRSSSRVSTDSCVAGRSQGLQVEASHTSHRLPVFLGLTGRVW